jgi:large subunit ribosomal protein L3
MLGILGKKIGMTNIFDQEGRFVPVTLIEAGPCPVLKIKSKDKYGYSAILLGYGEKKPSKITRPQGGWFKKLKTSPKKIIKELRSEDAPKYKTGDIIGVSIFKAGDYVDISGTTIGKGFQGGVKRWNWAGGDAGHGSMFHRAPGSIGASSFPSRVFNGAEFRSYGCRRGEKFDGGKRKRSRT